MRDKKSLEEAINGLRSDLEVAEFLRDLLTSGELKEMRNRWLAAQELAEGVPYSQIEKNTGLSSTTIARVSKWLREGAGGYRKALDINDKGQKENEQA